MSAALCVVGAVLLLAGAAVAGATRSVRDGMLLQALGATLLGIAGGLVLWSGHVLGSRFANGIDPSLGVDRLSGVFLLMLGIASGPVLVFAAGYLDASARGRAVARSPACSWACSCSCCARATWSRSSAPGS